MPSRTIAIGDIHGCSRALATLLRAIEPQHDDLFIPLGDYVDRGPDSRGVIEQLLELESNYTVHPIFGNHEEMMLSVLNEEAPPEFWLRYGGVETLDSYGFSGSLDVIPEAHRDFLTRCIDFVETDSHIFLHANYDPDVPLAEVSRELLRWTGLAEIMPGPHASGKPVVVGHTPDRSGEIMDVGYLKCIDTFCYGGQWLTAVDVQSGRLWQANEAGELRH
jgi:serine/threonine protein phosphatase 1